MIYPSITKLLLFHLGKAHQIHQIKKCHSVLGIKELIQQEKPLGQYALTQVTNEYHLEAINIIKRHYLNEHILVRSRKMDLSEDRAIDEYLTNLLKQGNSLCAKASNGSVVGVCVNFASSPVDPRNLRTYAFYRQDPNTKDFLYFTAKLQETPNLWDTFKQLKIFEIKMLTVAPECRRQGIAAMLVEKSKEQAYDQGYNVVRMDCINPYDYKVAEHCMLQCVCKFPLHKLRGANAPYIKRSSDFNRWVRVYVHSNTAKDVITGHKIDIESMIE